MPVNYRAQTDRHMGLHASKLAGTAIGTTICRVLRFRDESGYDAQLRPGALFITIRDFRVNGGGTATVQCNLYKLSLLLAKSRASND